MFRMHVLRALGAAAFFTACAVPAVADPVVSPTASPSPTPIPEITHVVTSDRADETLQNSARTTYVVTQNQIVTRGFRTVSDAIADIPGVEISNYGAIGANASYGIRGSSSAQVLVLVDGLPAPGSFANSVDLANFSTNGVRRIEVVEGGGSTLYGTGAIGGIINIITDSQHATASATLRYGSFDDREVHLEGIGFSFDRIVSENDFGLPDGGLGFPDSRQNADFEQTSGHFGFDQKLGSIEGSVRANLSSGNLGAPGLFPYVSLTSRQWDVEGDLSLAFSKRGPQSTSTLQFGGTRQQIAFDCDETIDTNCFQPFAALNTESRLDLGLRNVVTGKSERLIYGVDLSRGTVRSDDGGTPTPPPPQASTNEFAQTAAFVQENAAFGATTGYVGLRGERDGSLGGELSPSIGFVIPLPQELTLKLNYAHAFRAPNASELYFPGYGNPDLHPERAKVGDASLVDPNILGGATLTWFTNHTDDLIVAKPISQYTYQPQNVDHAAIQGFTLEVRTRPRHGIFTAINATDLYDAQDLVTGDRLPNDPVITVNLLLGILGNEHSAFKEAGITVRAAGQRGAVDFTQPLYDQPGAYTNLGAYARFRLAPNAVLSLRGYNLGNERYAEVSGYPMPGRSFLVEIGTK